MTLDASAYPHILDSVLVQAERPALLAFRGVSRELRDRADARQYRHAALLCNADTAAIRAPDGRRLPHLPHPHPPPLSRLKLVRVLDVRDDPNTKDGHPISALLPPLKPHIVRQLGTHRLPLQPQTHIDWTWRSAAPLLIPHPFVPPHDPLLLPTFPYSHADTGARRITAAARVVLHCDSTLAAGICALRPLLPHLRPRTDIVLVFSTPWRQLREWEVAMSCAARAPQLLAGVLNEAEADVTLVGVEGVHPLGVRELMEDARAHSCNEWSVKFITLAEWLGRTADDAALEM